MKYYIISGEASGDLLGAYLMKELKAQDANAEFRFWGGDQMQKVGGILVKHYKDLAFMGFWEVATHLNTILKNIQFCKKDILQYQPDALIFIDYPGFNLRIAKWAKNKGFKTFFYVAPQIWAWKENRIKTIKKYIDYLYVILPFEKPYFEEKHNYPVHYFGHPLKDTLTHYSVNPETFKQEYHLQEKPIIALLPGSRKQEIINILPQMLSVIPEFNDYQFVIARVSSIDMAFYQKIIGNAPVHIITDKTYELLSVSQAALVASGTATLQTALFRVPLVVCYKTSTISYEIAKRILKLKYISLVNLIMDKPVVTELIQNNLNTVNLKFELQKLLSNDYRERLLKQYDNLEHKLGTSSVSRNIAQHIIEHAK